MILCPEIVAHRVRANLAVERLQEPADDMGDVPHLDLQPHELVLLRILGFAPRGCMYSPAIWHVTMDAGDEDHTRQQGYDDAVTQLTRIRQAE